MSETSQYHIEVEDLVVRYGETVAVNGISFGVRAGEQLTLLGPSGCGKTTTLRAIAGLETPTSGEIRINGQPVFSSARKINVPTEKRNLSMVFQSYAIWPHMTVAENVGYGLKVRGDAEAERTQKIRWALELVQLSEFEQRKQSAAELSGGQQQRVALARALSVQPSVLLLDEPLSNLDARLRAGMRREMQALQKRIGITSVYVTHDQEEALVLSDRIIVMNAGRVAQIGTPTEIYNRPRTAFVADFVGAANLLGGTVRRDLSQNGVVVLETPGNQLVRAVNPGYAIGEAATVAVRPAFARLARQPQPDTDNNWPARVRQRIFLGDSFEYIVTLVDRDFVVRGSIDDLFEEDESVYVSADPRHCVLLDQGD
jgi:ABC-type Fe3+/spermidine/putrescine transport system ATPase subunit